MANTVYGPYPPTAWSGSTGINITRLDNLETQASVAMNGINPDLSGPFVLSGITCTKDGVTANQLDIASGAAYVKLSDGTTGKIAVGADNTHTTSTPSTTYYLFLNNDGTWQWNTTSTGAANSLPICQATTDGSGNISTVTDTRPTGSQLGLPLIVARAFNYAVTATTTQTPIIYVVDHPGFFRANLYFTYRNPTPQKVITSVTWYDVTLATTGNAPFMISSTAALGQFQTGTQASTTGNNQAVACVPVTFWAGIGTHIDILFQDPGGTPNVVLHTFIERLS